MILTVAWPLDGDRARHLRYVNDYWRKLGRFTDGFYMNEVGSESQSIVDANYQGNLKRLQTLKKQYDPGNLFRLNANVKPAV
jgi:FAD/FMN-containing dehydrogenase